MARRLFSSLEPLESRIAPAAIAGIVNPLPDIVAGLGKTSSIIDLGNMYADANPSAYHSLVQFTTNFDMDPVKAGLQAGVIQIELFDDVAPLTVQNFLNYVNSHNTKGDYNGIFFHRMVTDPGLQVIQAGGFDVSNPSAHIQTGPTVHNEYNEAYQNTTGTIALAKTGAGPNTGSSEFFFNMGDNSKTLGGDNNGGYTVFGRVSQGFDVLQKIFAQPIADETVAAKNSALGTVPYQGTYNADPDGIPATAAPALKPENYITITSAKTIAAPNAVSAGVHFQVASIFDHGTTTPSGFVKKSLTGDTLTLTYDTTKSGVADVTINALDSNNQVVGTDTFSVTFQPNMIVAGMGDNFSAVSGPGDVALGQIAVTNTGGGALTGHFNVHYYLSAVNAMDTTGTTLDGTDVLLENLNHASVLDHLLNVPSGKTALLTDVLTLPTSLVSEQTTYHIIATIEPAAPTDFHELYTDDVAPSVGGTHILANYFGSVISGNSLLRSHSSITYLDASGQTVVATLTGPGTGEIVPQYDGNHNLIGTNLEFFDVSAATNILFKSVTSTEPTATGVHTEIGIIRVNPNAAGEPLPIGTLNLGLVDLTNSFLAPGGVKALTLGNVLHTTTDPYDFTDSHQILLGNSAALAKVQPVVKVGDVSNTVINSSQLISALSMTSWLNDTVQDSSTLAGVKSFTVAGGMQANLDISAAYGDSDFMKTDAALTMATTTFKVGGALSNSTVKTAGNVGTADVGAIYGSRFLVGADSVPTQVSEFNSIRTIASFIVRGVAGESISMSDAQIAAANITSIKVSGVIEGGAGTDSWGFVADKIGTYSRAAVPGGLSASMLKNLTTGEWDKQDQYSVKLV